MVGVVEVQGPAELLCLLQSKRDFLFRKFFLGEKSMEFLMTQDSISASIELFEQFFEVVRIGIIG